MKATTWTAAVDRYVLPELPGEWHAAPYAILRRPIGPLANALVRNPSSFGDSYYVYITVQPLYVEMESWQGDMSFRLGHLAGASYWPGFATPEDGEASLRRMAELIREEALPYLDAHGTPEGFLALCRRAAAAHPGFGRVHILRQQAATEALLGDRVAVLRTVGDMRAVLDETERAMGTGTPAWLRDTVREAGRLLMGDTAELRRVERGMRARLGIPADM